MAKTSHFFVTGGAGFIGSHLCREAARRGAEITIFDNLSRRGSRANLGLLLETHPGIHVVEGDIRDAGALLNALSALPKGGRTCVFHEASQVAVTTSVADPRHDFEVNAQGTFNVLEAVRAFDPATPVFYASTNKVYGHMENVGIEFDAAASEYKYTDHPEGIPETQGLDFHSPYGCSKGAADQYVRDYARIYGIPTVVFRQSCIYGTHQFGVEDQGWIAWFLIAAELGRPVTIFGDGCQVRDVLWVDDLVAAYFAALDRIDTCAGQVFNIGGGAENRLTLRGLIALIRSEMGIEVHPADGDWRPGDQRVFISDITRAKSALGWTPRVSAKEGVGRLAQWIRANRALIERIMADAQPDRAVQLAREATSAAKVNK